MVSALRFDPRRSSGVSVDQSEECSLAWPNKMLLSSERRVQIDALYSLGQLV